MKIILKRDIVEKENLEEDNKTIIEIVKQTELSELFSSAKRRKMSGQEFKNVVRKGWEK